MAIKECLLVLKTSQQHDLISPNERTYVRTEEAVPEVGFSHLAISSSFRLERQREVSLNSVRLTGTDMMLHCVLLSSKVLETPDSVKTLQRVAFSYLLGTFSLLHNCNIRVYCRISNCFSLFSGKEAKKIVLWLCRLISDPCILKLQDRYVHAFT